MMRRWMTTICMSLSVTVLAWSAVRGDDGTPKPIAVDGPGRASVSSLDPKPITPQEKLPEAPTAQPGKTVASDLNNSNNCCDQANQKRSLIDTHTGPQYQVWGQVSYLYWRMTDLPVPQILATVNGNPAIGGSEIDFGNFNGGRFLGGFWTDCNHTRGFEVGGFVLQERTRSAQLSSNGQDQIERPFTNASTGAADAMTVAGVLRDIAGQPIANIAGTFSAAVSTKLGSIEGNFVRNIYNDCGWSLDTLLGFRYISLEDKLDMVADSQAVGGTTPFVIGGLPGFDHQTITDSFHTRNQFYAGQIGVRTEFRSGIWFGTLTGKLALGSNHQTSNISGSTVGTNPAGGRLGIDGGLLAVPGGQQVGVDANGNPILLQYANAGSFKTDWFTVAPEVGIQVGAQVTRCIRAHVGYNFLYINNVVRPGDLIDTTINKRYVPSDPAYLSVSGPARPQVRTSRDDFIAHGVEVGIQLLF